jgi:hypothetical protein
VAAAPHQLPLFVRVGASLDLGDLNREWIESQAVAQTRPNLANLEQSINAWFAANADAPAE